MDRIHFRRTEAALIRYGERISNMMKEKLKADDKVATGDLVNSIRPYLEREEFKQFLYVEFKDYGEYVHTGRRAGKLPPVSAIAKWISVRGLNLNPWAVAKSIERNGIKPSPFIDIFYEYTDELNDLIEESSREDYEEVIYNYIDEFNKNNK